MQVLAQNIEMAILLAVAVVAIIAIGNAYLSFRG